ncbi:MAG: phosphotransferase [Nanoarchaeota archaeon]
MDDLETRVERARAFVREHTPYPRFMQEIRDHLLQASTLKAHDDWEGALDAVMPLIAYFDDKEPHQHGERYLHAKILHTAKEHLKTTPYTQHLERARQLLGVRGVPTHQSILNADESLGWLQSTINNLYKAHEATILRAAEIIQSHREANERLGPFMTPLRQAVAEHDEASITSICEQMHRINPLYPTALHLLSLAMAKKARGQESKHYAILSFKIAPLARDSLFALAVSHNSLAEAPLLTAYCARLANQWGYDAFECDDVLVQAYINGQVIEQHTDLTERMLKERPNDPECLRNHAQAIQRGEPAEALRLYQRIPPDKLTHIDKVNIAETYCYMGNLQDAENMIDAVELENTRPDTFLIEEARALIANRRGLHLDALHHNLNASAAHPQFARHIGVNIRKELLALSQSADTYEEVDRRLREGLGIEAALTYLLFMSESRPADQDRMEAILVQAMREHPRLLTESRKITEQGSIFETEIGAALSQRYLLKAARAGNTEITQQYHDISHVAEARDERNEDLPLIRYLEPIILDDQIWVVMSRGTTATIAGTTQVPTSPEDLSEEERETLRAANLENDPFGPYKAKRLHSTMLAARSLAKMHVIGMDGVRKDDEHATYTHNGTRIELAAYPITINGGRHLSRRLFDRLGMNQEAEALYLALSHRTFDDDSTPCFLHGDPHAANILADGTLLDTDSKIGPASYDLGWLLSDEQIPDLQGHRGLMLHAYRQTRAEMGSAVRLDGPSVVASIIQGHLMKAGIALYRSLATHATFHLNNAIIMAQNNQPEVHTALMAYLSDVDSRRDRIPDQASRATYAQLHRG